MTVALNQVAKEAKLEEQILYACGLRSDEFSAYARHLESFQLIHRIIESSSQIDRSKQTPLIDVVKDYHCDWTELQGFIQPLLEDRHGLYVSKAFVNVLLSLEKSDLTLTQVFSELKTISEECLRFLTNLIFASSLFPKVQSALLHESGGVGSKLSKLNQHLSTHDKAHTSHLREAFDLDMAAKDLHSQSHEVVHHQSAHIDTHGRLEQDKRETGIRSTQAKDGIQHTQLVHDDLNHGRVLIDAHSDISNHAGKAMDGANELPRLDLAGVTEAIQIATRTVGMPNIGSTEHLPLQRGGPEQLGRVSGGLGDYGSSDHSFSSGHDSARSHLSSIHDYDSVFSDISDVSDLDSRIEGLDPSIEEQLESFQSDYTQLTQDVSTIKDLFDAAKFTTRELANAPKDIKELLRFYVTTNLSPQDLRDAEGVFNEIKGLTAKLKSSLNMEDLTSTLSRINRADRLLCDLYDEMGFCAKMVRIVQENPGAVALAKALPDAIEVSDAIEVLNEEIPISIQKIQQELQLITDVETLDEVAKFKAKYGALLSAFTNWKNSNPGELNHVFQGHDPDVVLKTLTDLTADHSVLLKIKQDYNLAIKAFIDGDLHDYATFLANEQDRLSTLSNKLSPFKDDSVIKTDFDKLSHQLKQQYKLLVYLDSFFQDRVFDPAEFDEVIMKSVLDIDDLRGWVAQQGVTIWRGNIGPDIKTMAKYSGEYRNLMRNNYNTKLLNDLSSKFRDLQNMEQDIINLNDDIDNRARQIVADLTPLELSIWAQICNFFSSVWAWLTD